MNKRYTMQFALAGVILSTLSCGDPLKDPQTIEDARVLGVRIATQDDHASLEPGEAALISLLVAGTEGTLGGRVAYTLCEAADSARGVPYCSGLVISEGTTDLDGTSLSVDVPDSVADGSRLALLGVVCFDSEPSLVEDPLDWGCAGSEEGLKLSFDAWTTRSGLLNRNPDLSEVSVQIAGEKIPLDELSDEASCANDAPSVSADKAHDVVIYIGEGAREPGDVALDQSGESLQISHFSTSGLFERQYSFVEPEQDPETILEFEAPPAGEAVKQYLVVRDRRGGVSWVSWSFCSR